MGFFGDLWKGVKSVGKKVGNVVGEVTGYNQAQRNAESHEQQMTAAQEQAAQRQQAWTQYQDLSANAANIFSNMYQQQGQKAAQYTEDIGAAKNIYGQLGNYATNMTAAGARGEAAAQAGLAGTAQAANMYQNATGAANAGLATTAGGVQSLQNLDTGSIGGMAAQYEQKYDAGNEAQQMTEAARRNQQSALRNAGLNRVQAAMGASQGLTDTYNQAQAQAKSRQLQAAGVGQGIGAAQIAAQQQAAQTLAQTGLSQAELQQSGALKAAEGTGAMANQQGQLGMAGANAALAGQQAGASAVNQQAQGVQSASAQQASLAQQAAQSAGQGLSQQAATAAGAGQNTSTVSAMSPNANAAGAAGATMQGAAALAGAFSDKRLKTDFGKAPDVNDIVSKIKAVSYRYKSGTPGVPDTSQRYMGTTAQDLEKTPLKAAVVNTPQGKMVNGTHVALADLDMIKQLNERLRKVEGNLKGVK